MEQRNIYAKIIRHLVSYMPKHGILVNVQIRIERQTNKQNIMKNQIQAFFHLLEDCF